MCQGQMHGLSHASVEVVDLKGAIRLETAVNGSELNPDEARFIAKCLTEAASRVENGVKGESK